MKSHKKRSKESDAPKKSIAKGKLKKQVEKELKELVENER